MKRIFTLTVGLFAVMLLGRPLLAGPERLEAKSITQPVMEQTCNWTGLYIGAHVGYGGGDLTWVDADSAGTEVGEVSGPETLVEHTQNGVLAGGQLGYNYQIGSWLVLGGEGTFSYSEVKANSVLNLDASVNTFDTRHDWLGTLALRVGVPFHHFLFYGKGGGAFSSSRYKWVVGHDGGPVEPFNADEVRTVPMVGAGVEYAISCHWSVKVEYNHLFLGNETVTGTRIDSGVPESESFDIDLDQNSAQVGLNYKF